jgi:hypothetical protein
VDSVVRKDPRVDYAGYKWREPAPLPDGDYSLAVFRVNETGNRSAPLIRSTLVTPVIPHDNETGYAKSQVSWRDFGVSRDYVVYLGKSLEELTPHEVSGNILSGLSLARGATYSWYVLSSDGRYPAVGTCTFTTAP